MKKFTSTTTKAMVICEAIMNIDGCKTFLLALERDYCVSNVNYKEVEMSIIRKLRGLISGLQSFYGAEYQWDDVMNKCFENLTQWVLSGMISEPEDDEYFEF